jgi:hypothetical protein
MGKKKIEAVIEACPTIGEFEDMRASHSKDGKLWLDRLVLKKDDGEMAFINLDQYTVVEPG